VTRLEPVGRRPDEETLEQAVSGDRADTSATTEHPSIEPVLASTIPVLASTIPVLASTIERFDHEADVVVVGFGCAAAEDQGIRG